jgi:hypothetical protein
MRSLGTKNFTILLASQIGFFTANKSRCHTSKAAVRQDCANIAHTHELAADQLHADKPPATRRAAPAEARRECAGVSVDSRQVAAGLVAAQMGLETSQTAATDEPSTESRQSPERSSCARIDKFLFVVDLVIA